VTPEKPRPAAQTLGEAEEAGNILNVVVEQQLLSESVAGDSLPDVCLPDVPLPDAPLRNVPLPNVPLPDVPLPEAYPDRSVGEERTSPRVAEEARVQVRVGFLSCELHLL
jgi:hypothetical protein